MEMDGPVLLLSGRLREDHETAKSTIRFVRVKIESKNLKQITEREICYILISNIIGKSANTL